MACVGRGCPRQAILDPRNPRPLCGLCGLRRERRAWATARTPPGLRHVAPPRMQKLEDYSLGTWDHRAHLRLAWLYLSRLGRREGMARIHASIKGFIANSPITK
jgi:hypothetical protein